MLTSSFILQTGFNNEILRNKSKKITQFGSYLKKLEKKMIDIIKKYKGIGLAAPQVGINEQLIICIFNNKRYVTYCNPEIIYKSSETIISEEGCLSLPGVWADVERPKSIIIKYQDIKGQKIQVKLENLNARIFLHELDHLNGVLFMDLFQGNVYVENDTNLKDLDLDKFEDRAIHRK